MKLGIWLVLALLLGTVATHWLLQDRGYVLINFRGFVVEMSLPVLVFLLVMFYLGARLIFRLLWVPRQLGEVAAQHRVRRAHARFVRGLIELEEGNFAKGERLLAQGARQSDMPLLNYLLAARAAQRQGASERRDNWLKLAYEETPAASTAVLLTQAELQAAHGQYEQALATLRKLEESAPGHTRGLALLARLYEKLGDWEQLRELLPRLRRSKAMDRAEIGALAVSVHRMRLDAAAESTDVAALRAAWQEIPRAERRQPALLAAYAEALGRAGSAAEAEKLLRKRLNTDWDQSLIALYGLIDAPDRATQLKTAEKWLHTRGEDPTLLLTAARLCMRNELWGKARSYLEASLAIQPDAQAYELYGELLERLGESDQATEAFRLGLSLTTGGEPRPALPRTTTSRQ